MSRAARRRSRAGLMQHVKSIEKETGKREREMARQAAAEERKKKLKGFAPVTAGELVTAVSQHPIHRRKAG